MTNEMIISESQSLYSDIDCCITELLKARTEHNSENEGKALFKMESLMVSTLQHLACIIEQPSLPSNIDEAAKKFAYDVCKQLPNGTEKDSIVYYAILAAKAGAEWMASQGVSLSHLIAWYIQSVDAHEPVWTEEHLEELVKDYILIPKN